MGTTARDLMVTNFPTLHPSTPIAEAVREFARASREQNQRVFGIIVTDDDGRLVGMISMYDILLLMRPKHIHIWGEMKDIDIEGFLDEACRRAKSILVGDIMTTDVVVVAPDTHILMIVDIMLRKHIRRIPVLEEGRVIGIVYISGVFGHIMDCFLNS